MSAWDGFQPGGESAVDRATELTLGTGPRNTFVEKSSSPAASDTVLVQSDVQRVDTVLYDEPRPTTQPRPSQAPTINVQPVTSHDLCLPVTTDRPRQARQAPDRLCVGNPLDPRFNRTRGR